MSFSKRMWFESEKILQISDMDSNLRRDVWNLIYLAFWEWKSIGSEVHSLARAISNVYFGVPFDEFKNLCRQKQRYDWYSSSDFYLDGFLAKAKNFILNNSFNQVCDFMERVATDNVFKKIRLQEALNIVFEKHVFWYRFASGIIVPITNELELREITETGTLSDHVANHFKLAIEKLSDKTSPDYRNAIKEAMSWVEWVLRSICWNEKLTCGDALKEKQFKELFPELKPSIDALWGYASNEARHASKSDSDWPSFEEAKFIVIICSSIANYIRSRAISSKQDSH